MRRSKGGKEIGVGRALSRLAMRVRSHRFLVQDHSMEPAFKPGDRLLVFRRRPGDPPPPRGVVVVVRDPEESGRLLLKRVASSGGTGPTGEPILELRGDAAVYSRDSRAFGPVPLDEVVGRVWFRYGPPERRGEIAPPS